jgi:hypothetical protein
MPENAGRAARFEALAHVAASIPRELHRAGIKLNRLKSVLNSGPLANFEIVKDEDPHEFAFTESFAFIDGPFTVFPGIADDTTFILQHLLKAIFRHRRQIDNQEYLDRAFQLTLAVLLLSDEIARRAGVEPDIDPVYAPESPVGVPFLNRLSQLKNAVVFHGAELEGLLRRRGVPFSALDDLTTRLGAIDLEAYRLHRGELFARPIVSVDDHYVVALPGRLLNALAHSLINLTNRADATREVVARYTQAVWETVVESLFYLDLHLATPPEADLPETPHIMDGVFHLDTDKALYVILATDPLAEYDSQRPFSEWRVGNLPEQIKDRMDIALSLLFTSPEPPNDVLVVELVQGVGRHYALPVTRPVGAPFLYMVAADLHTVAQLEAGNSLVLWKYAHAAQRIRQTTGINKASALDEFYLYRRSGYSYYVGDEERPTHIHLLPGYAGDLREELRRSRDWHCVRSYRRGPITDLIEVTLLFSDSRIPIYVTKESILAGATEMLVERLPLPVWVTGASYETSDAQRDNRRLRAQLVEAIGYWLWQFTTSLTSVLFPLAAVRTHVLIEVHVDRTNAHADESTAGASAITVTAEEDRAQLRVNFTRGIDSLLARADNLGEREMMRHVLRGLRSLLTPEDQEGLSDQVIASILDRHAPLGVKKKLLLFDSRTVPEILRDGLPTYRPLQKADENELLDELGDYLMNVKELEIGPIPDDQRTSVLRDAVGFFYEELERFVATLSPDGLLEWLVAHQEAVTRNSSFNQLTIPTRLACFSSEAEMVKKLQEEVPRQNATIVASRFIIEYVTARPPKGLRPISLSVYDRLQALAWHITNFGFESDLIHFGLADHRMEILPSRRLGADRRTYERARSAWAPKVMRGDIRRSGEFFNVLWQDIPAADASDDAEMEDLNAAAVAEFGFSLTEQLDFIVAAIRIGQAIDPAASQLPRDEFVTRMAREMNWGEDKASRALEMLSLYPRDNFLNPGAPYRGEDVYPWRYNRALSYLRRPFLIRYGGSDQNAAVEVLWGIRNLNSFWKNITALCREGRLKARSQEMVRLMGEFNRRRGDKFNDEVADVFAQDPRLIVRSRVKKVAHLRLRGDKGDLGDIDVLVVDKRRKRLLPMECKDLALARTPYEMSSEIVNLFRGSQGKKSIIELHQQRVQWVREHLLEVLEWLGVGTPKGWKIEPLIVVDRELFTPYLQESPIPIVPLEELKRAVLDTG